MYRLKGLIYGVISSATFGLIPLFALPAIRNGIGVDSVMFYRFGISALVLGLWLVIRRYDLRISGRELFTLAGLGIFYATTFAHVSGLNIPICVYSGGNPNWSDNHLYASHRLISPRLYNSSKYRCASILHRRNSAFANRPFARSD